MNEGGPRLTRASSPGGGGDVAEPGTPRDWRGGWEVPALRVLAPQASEKNTKHNPRQWGHLHQ